MITMLIIISIMINTLLVLLVCIIHYQYIKIRKAVYEICMWQAELERSYLGQCSNWGNSNMSLLILGSESY